MAWLVGFIAMGVAMAAVVGALYPKALDKTDEDWGPRQW